MWKTHNFRFCSAPGCCCGVMSVSHCPSSSLVCGSHGNHVSCLRRQYERKLVILYSYIQHVISKKGAICWVLRRPHLLDISQATARPRYTLLAPALHTFAPLWQTVVFCLFVCAVFYWKYIPFMFTFPVQY